MTSNTPNTIDTLIAAVRRMRNPAELSGILTFEDRLGYIAFRTEWRTRYAALTSQVREAKQASKGHGYRGNEQSRREALRVEARIMMALRTASKERATTHRAAFRATKAA